MLAAPCLGALAVTVVAGGLVRCPQVRGRKCFFQKHDAGSFGEHVRRVSIHDKNGDADDYLYIDDTSG